MARRWSIQNKLLLSMTFILLLSLCTIGALSVHLFRSAMTERLERYELVRTVEAIRNEVDKAVSVPLAQAQQLAANTYLLDWMAAGEPAEGIAGWQRYAQSLKQSTGAVAISWASEATGNYYDDSSGLLRQLAPDGNDAWFKAFLASGRQTAFDLGSEAGKADVIMFINALARDAQGHRAVASLGMDVTGMAQRVRQMAVGDRGQVYVVDEQGRLQIHRDPALVKVDNKVELKSLPGMGAVAAGLLRPGPFNLARYEGPQGPMIVASSHLPNAGWFVVVELAEDEVFSAVTRTIRWLVLLDTVILLASLMLMAWVSRTITRPLARLRDAMHGLARGEGDLTQRLPIDTTDEVGEIAESFNRFIEQLRGMFLQVRDQAVNLNQSVEQLGQMADRLAHDARDNAGLAEATAATIQEITVSVAHIADNTQAAAHAVGQAGQLSEQSGASVNRVSSEIGEVAQSMDALDEQMRELESRSRQVGSIAGVIKGIADQTNLLALNAAIEAARAGEQGRGFAVVADEVRQLAERTGSATVEIEQMVGAMRNAAESALGRVAHTHGTVKGSVAQADIALGHIGQIKDSMDGVVRKTHEIRDAANEQSRATEDMARAAERMSARAQAGDTELARAREVVQQLEQLSTALRQVVSGFRL
ncbi:methyl-accepting chemotaxis protein [Chitiniphilus purpureus]|uniref:Methyl-accepting chemotaxis protein n=1 Tax=Chitiniphilus purpureus TaxID=2981137 RepID=A0ABY6DH49_9NEIS|nr:methyl-accepting chemotaxis protein [Chitiniphilus sp. CD1]UXY13664.1 methyl-accepting chemotaxis protein [Chitiniphilus sp. CD1]